MPTIPTDLKYTKSHEWLKQDGDVAIVGLTDYAQDALGDLVFVNLPEEGDEVTAGEAFADVESVKAVSDIYSPVTGTVEAINEELLDSPELINESPYDAWFVKVSGVTASDELLDAAGYEKLCDEEA
ncbi:MAG: glycine cleavage system protein GcvH [Coriobacteriales bacterium]